MNKSNTSDNANKTSKPSQVNSGNKTNPVNTIDKPVGVCKHSVCQHFVPIDVAKGLCMVKNAMVLIDDPTCSSFCPKPHCGNCGRFTPGSGTSMGMCHGFSVEGWTYPELLAVNCEGFVGHDSKASP
ncbi:MAG: 4-hydroxyphenylacetate decarboxylase small subunit [Candidatus Ozemobacteraceae bacterium]